MPFQPAPFPSLHHIPHADRASREDLSLLIQSFPVIDNHAHNLLDNDNVYGGPEFPFESLTSEAQGAALTEHAHTSLSHMRAIKQLSQLYDCPETIRDVKAARYEWIRRDHAGMVKKCLEGTHAIMMDDGLNTDTVHPYKWHQQFVPQVARIVRIETVASGILEQLVHRAGLLRPGIDADWARNQSEAFFIRFNGEFRNQIRAHANDPDVRGFKSVICYRTGLDISLASRKAFRPHLSLTESDLLTSFHTFLQNAVRTNNYRIERKAFNDYLVVAVCDVLDKRDESLPFQFHTGLGDSDINLVKANPAYMQELIEGFPDVDFVLLHSSYPYTREAGYLASTYANAWLDIGEVFPMLSREGQESVLKQALELAPTSKILWSTDGHHFPETYWLANKQFRDVLETVLLAGITAGDYSIPQALNVAVDIMFWNSDTLYDLDEERKYPFLTRACGRRPPEASLRTLVNPTSMDDPVHASVGDSRPPLPEQAPSRNRGIPTLAGPSGANMAPKSTSPGPGTQTDLEELDSFLENNASIKYIWIQYLDYTATQRQRMVPVAEFRKQLTTNSFIGITPALLRLLQNDTLAPGATISGQFFIKPDLSTLALVKGLESPSASIQTWWLDGISRWHLRGCPRWALQSQANLLKAEYGLDIIMGCEIEIVFMLPQLNESKNAYTDFLPLNLVHSWSNMSYQQLDMLPMVEEIVEELAAIDIHIPQFHSESAPGQWEFPLPQASPLRAIDMLYQARGVISNVVRKHGLKATVYPRPHANAAGSACHTHFSVHGPEDRATRLSNSFVAGVLQHMSSIAAFTLPLEESYERVKPGIWSGGEYITWGTQNREVPLRKCGERHYELKIVDGVANMYLGVAALLASGLEGIRNRAVLKHGDCLREPAKLNADERAELGIVRKLPKSLRESLRELEGDRALGAALGEGLVADYIAVKRAEVEMLEGMEAEERRRWLMERY